MARSRTIKLLVFGALAAVLTIVGIAAWGVYSFKHTPLVTPGQMQDIQIALKGSMGQALFGGARPEPGRTTEGTGLDALLAPPKEPHGEGLIADYQRDPKKFKRYAELFDTATNALQLGRAVQGDRSAYQLPMSSSELPLANTEKLDAWRHPYCVNALKSAVVVVSGGPAVTSFTCSQQQVRIEQLASAQKSIFQTEMGEVVVVVPRGEPSVQQRVPSAE